MTAVLYGVGHRLDENPEDLFTLRQVDHVDLIDNDQLGRLPIHEGKTQLNTDLSALFGIDIAETEIREMNNEKPAKTIHKKKAVLLN